MRWLAGATFVILGLTGLNFTYGKKVLLPLIGPDAFSAFTDACKYAHNFLSFPFVLGVAGMLLLWAKDNLPTAVDVKWLKEGGGFVGSKHPPAWQFNAGQKLLFSGVVFPTILVATPGLYTRLPVLPDEYRRHADCGNGSRRRGYAVHCRYHCPHLHRHHRHGRWDRRHDE